MLHKLIIKIKTKDKGYGLFATRKINKNEIVWELDNLCKIFPLKESIIKKYPLAFQFGDNYVFCNDDSDFMNHSCDPNTWWGSDRQLIARRRINKGEEITYDYSTTDVSSDWISDWECKCGSSNCRKHISNKDCLKKSFQLKYKNHLPSWTQKYIKENG